MMEMVADMSATAAPRTGADLREARERLGYALPDVADWLRIKLAYLEALEDGRVGDLPGVAYATAFLRSYAQLLGLDPDEVFRKFKHEADKINQKTQLEFPAPKPSRTIPHGALALMGIVLAITAYAGWYRLSGQGRLPAETVTPVPARLAPLAQQAVPAPPVAVAPAPPPAPESQAAAEPPVLLPMPNFLPSQAAAMPLPPPPAPPPVAQAAVPQAPAAPVESRMTVRAKAAQVWIQVRERGGPVLVDKVLRPGESLTLPNRANLLLTTGNALNTEFLVDGEATPGLGSAKGVKRDLAMEPDVIKDGRFAAQNGGGAPAAQPVAAPVAAPTPVGGNGAVTRAQ